MRGMRFLRRITVYISTLVLVAGYPLAGMASAQEAASTPTPSDTQSTTQTPSSSSTSTPSTTPTTSTPTPPPEPKPTYVYNAQTGHWDSEKWQYNPATGAYEKPPAPVIIEPKPTDTTQQDANKSVDTTVKVDNTVQSQATSGSATVSNNGTAGSATSGDASAAATIVNMVNSSIGTNGDAAKVASFTKDVYGDVSGDIILSPLLLKAMLEAKAPTSSAADTTINAENSTAVNNTVTVGAQSGDATVAKNTSAGDATTGSATAVANVVNILNSMIATQQSFIGTINIYGNLNGDILLAPDFIPQLVASNKDATPQGSTKVSSQDTQTIVNNVSAVANSGAASVFGNTSAGNATTGDAQSNVVLFNLSGHQVVAKNSLLVFVNVLGKWVGVIVDAPEGATAAMVSNGVTSNTYAPDLTVNSESTAGITNTIAVTAQSGDATVSGNTSAGNAVSGSARAMANIANITGSQFSASDWFGILFINVYQNWFGNFGVKSLPSEASGSTPSAPIEFHPAATTAGTPPLHVAARVQLIDSRAFIPPENITTDASTQSSADQTPTNDQSVLGTERTSTANAPYDFRFIIIIGSIVVIGLSAIGLKRLIG